MACFPHSLSTQLSKQYVQQTFDWFLAHPNRFLFHLEKEGKVVGYCGGFVPTRAGDGSSSGMLQHAFSQALTGLLLHPWLLWHSELKPHYAFLWRNIKQKVTGKIIAAPIPENALPKPFSPYCGLVVIGVHPAYRGAGVARQLIKQFEQNARLLNQQQLKLSVKKNNTSALKAYLKAGWYVGEEHAFTYVMIKSLAPVAGAFQIPPA